MSDVTGSLPEEDDVVAGDMPHVSPFNFTPALPDKAKGSKLKKLNRGSSVVPATEPESVHKDKKGSRRDKKRDKKAKEPGDKQKKKRKHKLSAHRERSRSRSVADAEDSPQVCCSSSSS
jgi:hypothetical protein